jgi:acetyl esterase/lipase
MRRGGVIALAVAFLCPGGAAAASATASTCAPEGPLGSGAAQVWIMRPSNPRSIVVYAHGWTAVDPLDWHRRHLRRLCTHGSIVVFPRYQLGSSSDTFESSVAHYRQGLQTAFSRLGRSRLPVVAAGFSFGGTLAYYLGTQARAWKLPVPRAVYSIFPTGPIVGVPPGRMPSTTDVTVLAGADDEVVGTLGAEQLFGRLSGHPPGAKHYRLVRSTSTFQASHESPQDTGTHAFGVFWAPLDALVVKAQGQG